MMLLLSCKLSFSFVFQFIKDAGLKSKCVCVVHSCLYKRNKEEGLCTEKLSAEIGLYWIIDQHQLPQ